MHIILTVLSVCYHRMRCAVELVYMILRMLSCSKHLCAMHTVHLFVLLPDKLRTWIIWAGNSFCCWKFLNWMLARRNKEILIIEGIIREFSIFNWSFGEFWNIAFKYHIWVRIRPRTVHHIPVCSLIYLTNRDNLRTLSNIQLLD